MKLRRSSALVIGLSAFALLVAGVVAMPRTSMAVGTEKCPTEGGVKLEAGPWNYCTTDGSLIVSVCVKAGNRTFSFFKDGTDGCYGVKGLGTSCVYVEGGGTGRDCKDISNVVFYVEKK
ncbi:MAG: hypothetical protein U0704_16755 [Candidatus Eisenbacteria bacterium]